MSLKNTVRKTIAGVMTAAAVSCLAGCAANEAPDGDPHISDVSSAETVGSSAPDTEDSGAESTVDTPIVTDDADPEDKAPTIQAQSAEAAAPVSSEAPWSTDADTADNEETAEPEPEVDMSRMPAPAIDAVSEWTETPASGTFYVNDDGVSSREKPIQGSTRVKSFNTNDTVTVTASTNTGYYKLSDGSFLHQDFTSSKKIESVMAPIPDFQDPAPATKPNSSGNSSNSNSGSSSGNSDNSSSSGSGTINSEGYYEVPGTQMKVATSKVGMELDANGLPVDTTKYPYFRDDSGQDWMYDSWLGGWEKGSFTPGGNGSHTPAKPSGEKVGY